MAPQKLSGQCKRRATNTWTKEQRTVLHVLYHHSNFSPAVRTAIFNHMFKEHLDAHGFPHGLRNSVLYAQYQERLRDHRPNQEWKLVCKEPATDGEWRDRNESLRKIQRVAQTLENDDDDLGAADPQDHEVVVPGLDRLFITPDTKTPRKRGKRPAEDQPTLVRSSKRTATTTVASLPSDEPTADPTTQTPVTPTPVRRIRKFVKSPKEGTVIFERRNGPSLNLTPEKIEKAKLPPVPVPEALAHPSMSGLLYRYWDENSFGINTEQGFVAGRFRLNNTRPRTPKSTEVCITDIENHINRNKTPSPFVSASNCLIWLCRLALRERNNKGAQQGRITLINTDALQSKPFHMLPFHRQLRPTYSLTNGAWHYGGTHEFMIWHEIPQQAIISTFTINNLLQSAQQSKVLRNVLRMDVVGMNRAYLKTTIMSNLEEGRMKLTSRIAVAIAKLCRLMGLNGASEVKQIQHVVADVIQGWKVLVEHKTSPEWAWLATVFTNELRGPSSLPTFEREQELKMTFLNGVRAGLSDFNTLHDGKRIVKMRRQAEKVGLGSPTKVLLETMANATAAILSLEQEEEERYVQASAAAAAAARALLPGIENFLLESDVVSPTAGRSTALALQNSQEIVYDEDLHGL